MGPETFLSVTRPEPDHTPKGASAIQKNADWVGDWGLARPPADGIEAIGASPVVDRIAEADYLSHPDHRVGTEAVKRVRL